MHLPDSSFKKLDLQKSYFHKMKGTNKLVKTFITGFLSTLFAVIVGLSFFYFVQKWTEKQNEAQLMRNILEDLKADVTNLEEVISFDSSLIVNLDMLIKMRNANFNNLKVRQKFYDLVYYSFSNTTQYIPHNESLNQLKLGLVVIKSRALVDSIIDYESGKVFIDEQEKTYHYTLSKIYELKYDLMDETIYDDPTKFDINSGTFYSNVNPYLHPDKRLIIKFLNLTRDYKKENRFYYQIMLKNHLRLSKNIIQGIKKEYGFD
ncbi:MAG: hypothetical protein SFY32_13305 [Bacteroidota bacterium]|nr:hypothetical protein [Bacteroidota bacterium]